MKNTFKIVLGLVIVTAVTILLIDEFSNNTVMISDELDDTVFAIIGDYGANTTQEKRGSIFSLINLF